MKTFQLFIICLFMQVAAVAQQSSTLWKKVSDQQIALPERAQRTFTPNAYTTLSLDYSAMIAYLATAPLEFTPQAETHPLLVQLPNPDGTLETYAVVASPLLSEVDQLKYPDVKSYTGRSIDTPGKYTRFAHSMLGFNAMVVSPDREGHMIEVLAKNQTEYYMVYKFSDYPEELIPNNFCEYDDAGVTKREKIQSFRPEPQGATDRNGNELVKLRIYKFACATTGEFAQDHGGTVASVTAAMNNYMNQLNALYEFDVNIRLIFVDNVDRIFFTNPQTDPYTGTTVHEWMAQNPAAMNTILGSGGYDIGHVFARYMTGDAIGVAGGNCCVPLTKGRACSAGTGSYGLGFIKTIGHEIGHQWTGSHSWNKCGDGAQRAGSAAFEPGSGSTIMSYAGACGPDNVTFDNDIYYHAGTFDEIRDFEENGAGRTCGTEQVTSNHIPVVTTPYQNGFFIPIKTPFELEGSGTDLDGDALTYTWEQMDLGPEVALGDQMGNSPLFRSFPPSLTGSKRTFPRMQTILTNQNTKVEVLPLFSRDLTFRLTARDNKPGGGGVGFSQIKFHATDKAGPFLVTYPNTVTDILTSGSCVRVTWDVANTDQSPVNCKNVRIRLSTDAGNTWPTVLSASEPNDGIAYVTIPAGVVTSTARLRIDAVDNVFFDVSNANIRIQNPTAPTLSLCMGDDAEQVCLPATFKTTFSAIGLQGYNTPVTLAVTSGLPAGAIADFSKPTLNPGESSELTINLGSATAVGEFNVVVTATSGTITETRTIRLRTVSNDFSNFKLLSPLNVSQGNVQTPTLTWATVPDADSYDVELSRTADFAPSNILASKSGLTTGSFAVPVLLEKGQTYFWRVRTVNACGAHAWSEAFVFATLNEACTTIESNDLPKNIPSTGTSKIFSTLFISGGAVSDVNIKKLGIFHEFFKDLKFTLTHPDGTTIILAENKCGNMSGNFIFGFDDAAPNQLLCPPGLLGIAYKPINPLAILNGKPAQGQWRMEIEDNANGGGGAFQSFAVEVCAAAATNPPDLIVNKPLLINGGTNAQILDDLLKATDPDNGPEDIKFVLLSLPKGGHLALQSGIPLQLGATFTQQQITGGALRYYHYGAGAPDKFRFIIQDNSGGIAGVYEFSILPQNVSTNDLTTFAFLLAPNPANRVVNLQFEQLLEQDIQLQVVALDGRQLKHQLIQAGTSSHSVDISTLPTGMYFLHLTDGERQLSTKFVKE